MKTDDLPAPREGLVLTHFLTVSDVARSRAWYADVLGGQGRCCVARSWTGRGP
ncbi:MAG: hypothetical protein JOZ09_13435 [Pseudonocardiales bacterium]|jgi:hypothetical protein|nr:hypothetical protein [Pseudonocardiales bacterium]